MWRVGGRYEVWAIVGAVSSALCLCAVFLALPYRAGALTTTIYLTSTATSTWSPPSNWTSFNNTIEVIGGGGGASNGSWARGGGGGAYAKVSNQTLVTGTPHRYKVGAGGVGGAQFSFNAGIQGEDTFLCSDTSCNDITGGTVIVGAKGGSGGPNSTAQTLGGQASASVGTVKYSGGNASDAHKDLGGGGGGGAAGPNGAGLQGATGTLSLGGNGGNGGNGFGGNGGSGASVDGGNGFGGGFGVEWDTTHGSGGGGGAGKQSALGATCPAPDQGGGGNGGLYGGGGGAGGCGNTITMKGGDGAQGIIVIRYQEGNVKVLRITKGIRFRGKTGGATGRIIRIGGR